MQKQRIYRQLSQLSGPFRRYDRCDSCFMTLSAFVMCPSRLNNISETMTVLYGFFQFFPFRIGLDSVWGEAFTAYGMAFVPILPVPSKSCPVHTVLEKNHTVSLKPRLAETKWKDQTGVNFIGLLSFFLSSLT